MDPQLVALAAFAGQELVRAMVSDGWPRVREAAAKWFGRGDAERTERQAAQLNETRDGLRSGQVEQAVAAGRWQGRLEALLEEHPELADELTALAEQLQQASAASSATAADHGLAVGGDMQIRASSGGVGAGVIHGDVSTGHPPPPEAARG